MFFTVAIGVLVVFSLILVSFLWIAFLCVRGVKNVRKYKNSVFCFNLSVKLFQRHHIDVRPMMFCMATCFVASISNIFTLCLEGIFTGLFYGIIYGYFFVVIYSLFHKLRAEKKATETFTAEYQADLLTRDKV